MSWNRKTLFWGLGIGAVGLVLATMLAFAAGSDRVGPDTAAATADSSADTGAKPMEGMAMGGTSMDGSIRISAGDVSTFGITFDRAEVRKMEKRIRATGYVEFDETRMAYVSPKFGGWAERLHVEFTGQRVRRGQPLLEVYSPELVSAQEELLLAARMTEAVEDSRAGIVADGARGLLASARRRLEYWDISAEQIDRLLETGEVRKSLTLHAPTSGIAMEKEVVEGQAFEPGSNLYMIADLSEVWVNAEIFEGDIRFVREGMPAEISVEARPGETLDGTIEYVYPTLSEGTRSMEARIAVPNPGGELKPGMYATVRLTADLGEHLTVPTNAVLRTGERAVAFVDRGGGELVPRELRLGARGRSHVQVLEGLEAGTVSSPRRSSSWTRSRTWPRSCRP